VNAEILLAPELTLVGDQFERGMTVGVDAATGRITRVSRESSGAVALPRRALVPGFVNVHSHSFQRAIRGRTEHRTGAECDTFWTWREKMYHVAQALTPEDLRDVARMAFLEMALAGITTVGEFHYLHHQPDGTPYADPIETAKAILAAADEVGLRIVLLQSAYTRGGFGRPLHAGQRRFCTPDPEVYCANLESLRPLARVGVAPHSFRAVPLEYVRHLHDFGRKLDLPFHMHVSEQPRENAETLAEHGMTPVDLLANEGLLDRRFTGIHAVHITESEVDQLASAKASVCACPTTERNLGDGIVRADWLYGRGVSICFGSDSQIQIDPLEDARALEYHLRLDRLERVALVDAGDTRESALARRLWQSATEAGAQALAVDAGVIRAGAMADFFTIDLDDVSIADAEDEALISSIVFSLERTAIRDIWIGGRAVVKERHHPLAADIVSRFQKLQRRLWK
jgi:formimidoylglutamate deiminase